MIKTVVEIKNLSRQFGSKQALDDVNFQAEQGRIHGLVGVNGAGKTTMIKHMLGLLRAKSGSVSVFGLNPVHDPVNTLKHIGYLSEERDLPDWMTINELMRYTQAYHPNWDQAYAQELLKTFTLDASKKISQLSKGMRAQAGLIAAVAHRPELLILDEPSSGLDAVVREDILNAIVRTVIDDGRTVIFSSHLLDEVERMSDQITMINDGKIVFDGELDEVKALHFRSEVVFSQQQEQEPLINGVLFVDGYGKAWNVIHYNNVEELSDQLQQLGGVVHQTRPATLQEIFVARVGRKYDVAKAA